MSTLSVTPNTNEEIEACNSLKEALLDTISNLTSPTTELRNAAEERLKILEVTDDYVLHLTELTIGPEFADVVVRQMASILLKQFVEVHWSSLAESHVPPIVSENNKKVVRHMLPLGLKEPNSKVRSSVAYVICAIAEWDYPDSWPELINLILRYLETDNEIAVEGSMVVLSELSRNLTENQLLNIAPRVLPEMYKIFCLDQKHSLKTRTRCVEVFTSCVCLLFTYSGEHKMRLKSIFQPGIAVFVEVFLNGLSDGRNLSSLRSLQREILEALSLLVKNVPKVMLPLMPKILSVIWQVLVRCFGIHQSVKVGQMCGNDSPSDSDDDDNGGLDQLVFAVFEFIQVMLEYPKMRVLLKENLSDLFYYLIGLTEITEEQVSMWSNNPDQFVEDEDDNTFTYSVRISSKELLQSICKELPEASAPAMCEAVSRHVERCRAESSPNSWKGYEACMLAVGCNRHLIVSGIGSGNLAFNINSFLQDVVLCNLSYCDSPFLVGRCLWVGSRFAKIMNLDMIYQFLQTTVTALQTNHATIVRVSAARATWGFFNHLKQLPEGHQFLAPFLGSIMDSLLALATQFSNEVLCLVLETVAAVLSVNPEFTASVESKVTPLTIAIFLKHTNDPVMMCLIRDIFRELSRNPLCREPLQQRLIPTVVSILTSSPLRLPTGMQTMALDVLETLVRSSSPPLSGSLVNTAFPAAVQCILTRSDDNLLLNGGECLRRYLYMAHEEIYNYHDSEGRNGLWYILQIAGQLLNPASSDDSAVYAGELVSTLLAKAGDHLGDSGDVLLRAVLSKLQQVKALKVILSLVLVYAHLIHTRLEATLQFLESVPGPSGQSALQFVLTEWCSRQHLFYGNYEIKVTLLALASILQYGVMKNDSRLAEIQVPGERILNANEKGVKTRSWSRKYPDEWTTVPLLVKIFKLLLNEVAMQEESMMSKDNDGDETDDSDMEDGVMLSQLSSCSDDDDESGDVIDPDEVDPEILEDPIYHTDLHQFLKEYLKGFRELPCFPTFEKHLSPTEKQVLMSCV